MNVIALMLGPVLVGTGLLVAWGAVRVSREKDRSEKVRRAHLTATWQALQAQCRIERAYWIARQLMQEESNRNRER